jgi:hypothetical protein
MIKMSKSLMKTTNTNLVKTQEELINNLMKVEDDYLNYYNSLTPDKKNRISNSVNGIHNGLQAVAPIMCMGPQKCPFIEKCPIPDRDSCGELVYGAKNLYPIGRECILEKFFIKQKMVDYVKHLNVDPNNPIEMSIVNELALIDLYKNRALMIMSVGDKSNQGRDFMRVDIIGFNENGEKAEQASLHPAVEMIDRLEKRREKWLDRLMETRKSKADWVAKMGGNNSESKILVEIQKLREALNTVDEVKELTLDSDDKILIK